MSHLAERSEPSVPRMIGLGFSDGTVGPVKKSQRNIVNFEASETSGFWSFSVNTGNAAFHVWLDIKQISVALLVDHIGWFSSSCLVTLLWWPQTDWKFESAPDWRPPSDKMFPRFQFNIWPNCFAPNVQLWKIQSGQPTSPKWTGELHTYSWSHQLLPKKIHLKFGDWVAHTFCRPAWTDLSLTTLNEDPRPLK